MRYFQFCLIYSLEGATITPAFGILHKNHSQSTSFSHSASNNKNLKVLILNYWFAHWYFQAEASQQITLFYSTARTLILFLPQIQEPSRKISHKPQFVHSMIRSAIFRHFHRHNLRPTDDNLYLRATHFIQLKLVHFLCRFSSHFPHDTMIRQPFHSITSTSLNSSTGKRKSFPQIPRHSPHTSPADNVHRVVLN